MTSVYKSVATLLLVTETRQVSYLDISPFVNLVICQSVVSQSMGAAFYSCNVGVAKQPPPKTLPEGGERGGSG